MRKLVTCFLICTLVLISCFSKAQETKKSESNPTIDSLLNVLKIISSPYPEIKLVKGSDTSYINTLNILSREYINTRDFEKAMDYAEQAMWQAGKSNYKKGIAGSYTNIGNIYQNQGNYEKALGNYLKSLKIKEEINDKRGIANSYNSIGTTFFYQGNYQKALDNYLNAFKIYEEIGNKQLLASSYINIGNIYAKQGNYERALNNYLESLKIRQIIGDKNGISAAYNNIGNIYGIQENYEKSLEIHLKSLKNSEQNNDIQGMAFSYNNIGNVYSHQHNYDKALNFFLKALKINEELENKPEMSSAYANIGNVYTKLGKFAESNHFLNQSLTISKEIGYKEGIKDAYSFLSELNEKKLDYKQAYYYHKLYSDIKDTLLNEQSSKQIAEMNTKYDSERKDKELIKKDSEISKQQAETEKQNLQRNAFIVGFAFVLVLAFFIFRVYRQKQNANKLLEEKNILIENQKQLVEEKNLKITDSINYAKRIQQAILPSQELIKSFLPDSFIFFRPKDIVSGDFYWFSERGNKLLIAVADCTGHGVPGAFMSMIGNTLLNEIVNVKNICEPDKILNHLNNGIVSLLHQNNDSNTQDDGMDITILTIDKTNNEIEFAGANHFSYLINNNQTKVLNGDVFSIGGMFGRSDINFTSQKIKVDKDSTVYLFTDGFVDQFGGEKNTKYLSSRFEQLLQNMRQYDMEQQEESLIKTFDSWKGSNKQLDDLLVVGIRL